MSILPSIYRSTFRGTLVGPRAPPNAVSFQAGAMTGWKQAGLALLPATQQFGMTGREIGADECLKIGLCDSSFTAAIYATLAPKTTGRLA
jgi:enoyl-CoA hydratase/carnithine racemase